MGGVGDLLSMIHMKACQYRAAWRQSGLPGVGAWASTATAADIFTWVYGTFSWSNMGTM